MNILEMTDKELYELGHEILADKLGADQVERFIRQCKPGEGDYSVDRHKLLANQEDIDTIVGRIQERRKARKVEERKSAERFNAPHCEIRKMTDIEIFEIGLKVLVDKLGVAGYWRLLQAHFKLLRNGQSTDLPQRSLIENLRFSVGPSAFSDSKERVSWSGKFENLSAFYGLNNLMKQNLEMHSHSHD